LTIRKVEGYGIPKHDNFFTKVLICFMAEVMFSFHGGGFFLSLEYNGAQIILMFRIKSAI